MGPKKVKKGFTLIEIIVAIVLVGLVSGMAYSLLMFSNRMLANSNKHYDVQNDIRLASSYLTKELRFATDLEIISVSDSKTEVTSGVTGYNYFYIENGIVNQAIYDETTASYSVKPISKLIMGTESSFVKDASKNNVLNLTLTANQEEKKYSVSTAIVLENFPLISSSKAIVGNSGLAVKYKTKAPHASLIQVTSITITGDTAITTLDGQIDLDVIILPNDASIKSVVWSISDTGFASVDSAGVVTAQNNGTVIVTAIAADGSGISDTHTITISGQSSTPTPTPTITVTPEPTPIVTPIVTPTPMPTPIPTPSFPVNVNEGSTNTSNAFDVDFGNNKVTTIQLVESNNPLIVLTPQIGASKKNATLQLAGLVEIDDWIIVRFIHEDGRIAVVKFVYSVSTKWIKA